MDDLFTYMELEYLNRFLYWSVQFILDGMAHKIPLLALAAYTVAKEYVDTENSKYLALR